MAALALESSYRYQYSRSKKTGRHVHDHRISLCISRTVDHTQPNGHLEWVCTRRLCSCEVRILRGSHSVRRARTSPPPQGYMLLSHSFSHLSSVTKRRQGQMPVVPADTNHPQKLYRGVIPQPPSACFTLKFSGSPKLLPSCHISKQEQT